MLPEEIGSNVPLPVNGGAEHLMSLPLQEAREIFEREYLLAQINRFGGNISRTAEFVGMERSALHRKLRALGVSSDQRGSRGQDGLTPSNCRASCRRASLLARKHVEGRRLGEHSMTRVIYVNGRYLPHMRRPAFAPRTAAFSSPIPSMKCEILDGRADRRGQHMERLERSLAELRHRASDVAARAGSRHARGRASAIA